MASPVRVNPGATQFTRISGAYSNAADIVKAPKVFIGGYSRPTLHDTRLRLTFDLLGVPYTEAKVGRRVKVVFEKLNDDITLPQFMLAE